MRWIRVYHEKFIETFFKHIALFSSNGFFLSFLQNNFFLEEGTFLEEIHVGL